MSGITFLFLGLTLFTILFPLKAEGEEAKTLAWQRISDGISEYSFDQICVSNLDPQLALLSSKENLYLTRNGGKSWERIFRVRGERAKFNYLYVENNGQILFYILTSEGVFLTQNQGQGWEKIFSGIGEKERNVLSLASNPFDPEILYLGTEHGLFWSIDGGETWVKQEGLLSRRKINYLLYHPTRKNTLYVATEKGFFKSEDNGRTFTQTFYLASSEGEEVSSLEEEVSDNPLSLPNEITTMAIFPQEEKHLLIGTQRGLLESKDGGASWQAISNRGLRNTYIKDIAISENGQRIFVCTEKGIYFLNEQYKRWQEIYAGLTTNYITSLCLAKGGEEVLYATTDRGAFRISIEMPFFGLEGGSSPLPQEQLSQLTKIFQLEPTVREIQEKAISYADVSNKKIKWWHIASRLSALAPSFSWDKDIGRNNSIDIDRGSTTEADVYIAGPDETDYSRGISLSWDLGEFIWSSNQTSIDSRAKLMVELRDDILSEVTRLYFERKRLLMEAIFYKPAEYRQYLELLLRIDELTAHIDALTGGYLSKEIKKRNLVYPF